MFLILVEPLIIIMSSSHVVVVDAVVRGGVAGDCGIGTTRDDKNSMSTVAVAAIRVINKNITRDDVVWRRLVISACSGPSVSSSEAITEVLCTDFLLSAGIATAGSTLIERCVATSKKTLRDKVSTVTTVAAIIAVLTAIISIRSAILKTRGAVVVGLVPPGLGIGNSSITVIGSRGTSCKSNQSNNSLHFKGNKKSKKRSKKRK